MDSWQKAAVIISALTFLRLVYQDIKGYLAKSKKKAKQKKHSRSGKRKRK